MARHCFLTILTSGKPEVPNDATIISIKDEQLLNTGLWKTYWCVLRRVAGWVAWGCWDDYETNDDWDHSRKFPTFSTSKSERSCFDLMSILRMFAGVPQVAWKWLSTGRIKRWWNRVTNSNSSRQFVFGFFFAYLIAPCQIYQQTGAMDCGIIMDHRSIFHGFHGNGRLCAPRVLSRLNKTIHVHLYV